MTHLQQLDEHLKQRVSLLRQQITGAANPDAVVPPMTALLSAAMKNEWETALLSSLWVTDEADPELRVDLVRLAGDEAKHYRWIEARLRALGGRPPLDGLDQRTPLYRFLADQTDTFDRVVTGPFAREALAVARNEVFLEHCEQLGDQDTVDIYLRIQADEQHHHELGRRHLAALLTSPEALERAKAKVNQVLTVIEDIQEMAVMQKGVCRIPGC